MEDTAKKCSDEATDCEQELKAARNAEYLAKIDRAMEQLEAGLGQQHELIEV